MLTEEIKADIRTILSIGLNINSLEERIKEIKAEIIELEKGRSLLMVPLLKEALRYIEYLQMDDMFIRVHKGASYERVFEVIEVSK